MGIKDSPTSYTQRAYRRYEVTQLRRGLINVNEFIDWWKIEKRGTVRGLAKAMGVTSPTIYYWAKVGFIDIKYYKDIYELSDGRFDYAKQIGYVYD